MALFRKLFFKKPPDGLLEISEGVFVFDCCFTTDAWGEEDYKVYIGGIIGQLRDTYPDASILVFNFRQEETESRIANVLSGYDMTIMDYPRHYEGCPLLPMEVIHHFLRSCESWLSLGHQNVLLMHCERGGWPVLAFMLAALLIYRKQYTGEQKTLDMIYKQAPRELLHFLSPLNPLPSQLRYLQYVSRRNVATEWPPLDRALILDCVILRLIPDFDGDGGCRPIFRIYGQDPVAASDRTPKVLFSTPKRSRIVRHYKQTECELVKIDISCAIQGDVVLECISLHDDMDREEMMFRVMFNTAFIRSNILILNRDEIDVLWDAKDHFPKEFRTEVLFSDMDAAASVIPVDFSCFEEKDGLPVEAFAKVHEMFHSVDWLVPKTDAALNVLHQMNEAKSLQEKPCTYSYSHQSVAKVTLLSPNKSQEKQRSTVEDGTKSSPNLILEDCVPVSNKSAEDVGERKDEFKTMSVSPQTSQPAPQLGLFLRDSAGESAASPLPSPAPLHLSTLKPASASSVHQSAVDPLTSTATSHNLFPTNSSSSTTVMIQPPTPPPPPPPPLPGVRLSSILPVKDNSTVTARALPTPAPSPSPPPPPPPPPPSLPLKEKSKAGTLPSPPPPQSPTQPPSLTMSSKGNQALRTVAPSPSTPPPTQLPPLTMSSKGNQALRTVSTSLSTPPLPPTPPLKDKSSIRAGPPPPPPPPLPSGQAAGHIAAPSAPPPPPAPSSSSKLSGTPCQNSSLVPSAPPPPPVPSLKGSNDQNPSRSSSPAPPTPAPPFSSSSSAKGRVLSRTVTVKSNQMKKLKPLHWLKLNRAVQGSLWAEAQKSGEASKAPEIDMSELESLFSAAVPNSDPGGPNRRSGARSSLGQKPEKVQLIEHRRAYNCEIMLSKVKLPLHELVGSVLALEDSALDVDQVDNLIKFCPTKEEMELLKGYNGEKDKLGRCEQFFFELMQVPRVESKLRVFSFKLQFQSQVSDLTCNLNVVNSAAEQIRNSAKFKRVMQTILSLGNALNQGTARGSAVGFRLDSLLKLTETRARNNKMTLMHYLCKVLADKLPEVLDFSKDLASLEPASKIQLKYLAEEMQAISKGLEKVVQELSLSENDGPVSVTFHKRLKEFLSFSEAEVRSLALLYSGVGRNVDALVLYFGEDPARCSFEQVITTLLNFVKMFNRAHEENCKQIELDRKKVEKEAENEKLNNSSVHKNPESLLQSLQRRVK